MAHTMTAGAVENPGELPKMTDCVDDWSTIRVGQSRHQATQAALRLLQITSQLYPQTGLSLRTPVSTLMWANAVVSTTCSLSRRH